MSDFLRELEEDIQEEKLFNLWRKYGNYVIGLALSIVIATAGYTLWQYFKQRHQLRAHASFSSAVSLLREGKGNDAFQAFQAIAEEGRGGYNKLARLYEAALASDPSQIYAKMAQQNAADPALGNLPKILEAARNLADSSAMEAIQSLTAPNNAWAPLSLELLAFADLKKGDDVKAAKSFITILREPYATPSEQMRASVMLSQIDVPASFFEEEAKKEQ